jgi:peptidoglycan/LPS O-acetylase OafA/YrhL
MSGARPHGRKLHHIPALDGIRGVAVLLVLASHLLIGDPNRGIRAIAFKIANAGWIGVDIFFVLSGYLITSILRDSLGMPHYFRNFYMRRVLRIFPLYFGTLFFLFIVLAHMGVLETAEVRPVLSQQWAAWLYVINFVPGKFDSGWLFIGHFWSLAIEEQFYLVWPFVLFQLGLRKGRRGAAAGLAISIAARAVLQFVNASHPAATEITTWATFYWTICRLDGLAIGGFIALMPAELWNERGVRKAIAVAGTLLTATMAWLVWSGKLEVIHAAPRTWGDRAWKIFGSSFLALFAAFFIVAATSHGFRWITAFFSNSTLRFAGKYSYGMYVYHGILMPWFRTHLPPALFLRWTSSPDLSAYASFLSALVVVTAVSVASYEIYERQFLRLKALFPAASAH